MLILLLKEVTIPIFAANPLFEVASPLFLLDPEAISLFVGLWWLEGEAPPVAAAGDIY